MSTAMNIVQIIFQTVGIIFMLTFMFIGIWSFIVFINMNKNLRIKNYLLQKMNNNLSNLILSLDKNPFTKDTNIETTDSFEDFQDDVDDNIIKF